MTREIIFKPAYDKRCPDPNRDYGVHSADMIWILKGELGVITWTVFTGWHLPHVTQELGLQEPMGADISYHSHKPKYEGQELVQESCEWLDNKPCYYDGSSLQAELILQMLINEGSETVWKELERWYSIHLGELK